jgi:hypothetical protein
MEDKKHKEIMEALQRIEEKKYLPYTPYFDMLTPFRYLYEHPKMALVAVVVFVDLMAEINSKGIISAFLISIIKP